MSNIHYTICGELVWIHKVIADTLSPAASQLIHLNMKAVISLYCEAGMWTVCVQLMLPSVYFMWPVVEIWTFPAQVVLNAA